MTEKEKMLCEEMYNANYDQELIKERSLAKDKCYEYNNTKPSDLAQRTKILSEIVGSYKSNMYIEPPFYCDYGYNIEFGENFYSNHNLIILDAAKVKFGDNVFVAPNCGFYTAEHPLNYIERNKGLEYAKRITVGNNVWIGGNTVVLAGVTIGDNVVIGAGSVVNKDIPSNSVAVGVPCHVIKKLECKESKE